jgi:hypothetical protein
MMFAAMFESQDEKEKKWVSTATTLRSNDCLKQRRLYFTPFVVLVDGLVYCMDKKLQPTFYKRLAAKLTCFEMAAAP